MKILLATESYWPNLDGGSVFERALVHGLGERDHEVRVVAPSPTGKPYVETDRRSDIHRLRSFRVPGKFGKLGARGTLRPNGAVRKLVDGFQPDVIHIHNPFGIGRAALAAGQHFGIPVVSTNHNMPENTLGNFPFSGLLKKIPDIDDRLWRWQLKFLNQANFVTSPTKTAVDMLVAHGLTVPHRPISNGVDVERFNPDVDTTAIAAKLHLPKKPIVLYMGRIDGEKRLDVWLRGAQLIRKEIDAHFVLGGRGGETQALKRLAVSLGIGQHVTFAGAIDDDQLPAFYKLGTVFGMTSDAELQSLVTLEAMGVGLPVVAADAMALPELCHSGRNGYLFLAGDPKGFAQSAIRILRNPKMGQKMGIESRKIVEENHDVREMPQRYEAVYREVIR
jgi:glycosyltransferase involved in cell wall biosynthesis